MPARGINVLIHGDSASGKSWLAGSVIERLVAQQYSVCVLDPEGDYKTFGELPSMAWAEIGGPTDVPAALARLEGEPALSMVVDLSRLPHWGKVEAIRGALGVLGDLRRRMGRPHWVLVDEAHYALHCDGVSNVDLCLEGGGLCAITYRPSWLRPRVVDAMDLVISARTTDANELAFVASRFLALAGHGDCAPAAVADLPAGHFVLTQREGDGAVTAASFVALPGDTPHARHLSKYADCVVADDCRFFFQDRQGRTCAAAESLQAFRRLLPSVGDEVLADHAHRGDFSQWVRGVFGDHDLARQLRKVEARWRRRELHDLRGAIDSVIVARYGDGARPGARQAHAAEAAP
jgi:hypothetical protein